MLGRRADDVHQPGEVGVAVLGHLGRRLGDRRPEPGDLAALRHEPVADLGAAPPPTGHPTRAAWNAVSSP